jgi:hypothetical protein
MRYVHRLLAIIRHCRHGLFGLAGVGSFLAVLTWVATSADAQKLSNEGNVDAFVPVQAGCLIHVRFSDLWSSDIGKLWRHAGVGDGRGFAPAGSRPNLAEGIQNYFMVSPDDIETLLIAQMSPPIGNELVAMSQITQPWRSTPFKAQDRFMTGATSTSTRAFPTTATGGTSKRGEPQPNAAPAKAPPPNAPQTATKTATFGPATKVIGTSTGSPWPDTSTFEDPRTSLTKDAVIIATVKEEIALKEAKDLAAKHGRREVYKGMTYHVAQGYAHDAVLFLNERVMIRGTEVQIRRGIEAHAAKAKPHARLEEVRKHADQHIWIDWQRGNSSYVKWGRDAEEDLYRQFYQLKPLLTLKAKQVGYQLGKEVVVQSHSQFETAAEAEKAVPALRELVHLRRFIEPGMLLGALEQAKERADDQARDEVLTAYSLFLTRLEAAMREPSIKQNGTSVDVVVRATVDMPALHAEARELVKKRWTDPAKTEPKRILQTRANLRQILQALHQYESVNNELPPPGICDKTGQPLLSWRVAILPYLGARDLYDQFKLNEPWDSPHNKKLQGKMPKVYTLPGATTKDAGGTYYQAIVGLAAGWEYIGDADVPMGARGMRSKVDGLANTALVIEAPVAVPWTKPEDVAYVKASKTLPKVGGHFKDRVNLATFSSVLTVRLPVSDADMRALITRNAGKSLSEDFWRRVEPGGDEGK